MGRKPNALIAHYFERGAKINDKSNRYPHRCKLCNEQFPKGRIDSLTTHLTKKCPAISEQERVSACLSLNGINHAGQRKSQLAERAASGQPVDLPVMQQNWSALETLAEVSRQIDMNEKLDDRAPAGTAGPANVTGTAGPAGPANAAAAAGTAAAPQSAEHAQEQFEVREMHTLSNPPAAYSSAERTQEEETEHRLKSLLANFDSPTLANQQPPPTPTEAELSMAAAAAAAAAATGRLNTSLLDPQLRPGDGPAAVAPVDKMDISIPEDHRIPVATPSQQPWGELTYVPLTGHSFVTNTPGGPSARPIARGGLRLDYAHNGGKARHSRARFDATRRKEVQEVRKLGACIRCRILRKTCSPGVPCDTCRKVLSPRIWKSGCVRTKFSEQLEIYSVGVQIVLASQRINAMKSVLDMTNNGMLMVASHFPESNVAVNLDVYQSVGPRIPAIESPVVDSSNWPKGTIAMIDDSQDVPTKVEAYMRAMLPEFIDREPSPFVRLTLSTALQITKESEDELLKKSMELWGLVEILDRERQWQMKVSDSADRIDEKDIKADVDHEVYTTLALQLTAAAERKAGALSKSLLTGMQRVLQDSKTKIDFSMFFTTLILLICVEKSTWAFKAWEQDSLLAMWPLEKHPSSFSQQGIELSALLRMLLDIRRALPRMVCREADGVLATEEEDARLRSYFQSANLTVADVQAKQDNPVFSPTDSRSFELLFCSTLLLPVRE